MLSNSINLAIIIVMVLNVKDLIAIHLPADEHYDHDQE